MSKTSRKSQSKNNDLPLGYEVQPSQMAEAQRAGQRCQYRLSALRLSSSAIEVVQLI